MITNIASPQNYLHNLEEKIIINSVRESVLALLLDYIREHTSQNILDYATIEQDPYKTAFDYSKTALKVGRRALYSMHKGTSKVVVPLPANELITRRQLEEYEQLSVIDQVYAHSERLRERTITEQEARKNTQQLGYLNQEHRELWKNYHMTQNKKMFLKRMI